MRELNHSIKYQRRSDVEVVKEAFIKTTNKFFLRINEIKNILTCNLTSKLLILLILLKCMQKEFSSLGIRIFDAIDFARDSRLLNAQDRLNLLRKVMKMNGDQTAQLFAYLNYVYNTSGSNQTVQEALHDWYKIS